jgi:hypothetical protein
MHETRKEKVKTLLNNLTEHFNKATLSDDDWHRWANLDFMCAEYIKHGKPDWSVISEMGRGLFARVMSK